MGVQESNFDTANWFWVDSGFLFFLETSSPNKL